MHHRRNNRHKKFNDRKNQNQNQNQNQSQNKKEPDNFKMVSTKVLKTEDNKDKAATSNINSNQNQNQSQNQNQQHNRFNKDNSNFNNRRREERDFNKRDRRDFYNNRQNNQNKVINNYNNQSNENRNKEQKKNTVPRNIIPYKLTLNEKKTCIKCAKVITEMSSAIKDADEEKYYHFDCVIQDLKSSNQVNPAERCVYLGSGIFGIIEDVKSENSQKFVIKKKLNLHNKPVV